MIVLSNLQTMKLRTAKQYQAWIKKNYGESKGVSLEQMKEHLCKGEAGRAFYEFISKK